MKQKKILFTIILIAIICISSTCFAAFVPITDENLEKGIQEVNKVTHLNWVVSSTDKTITLTIDSDKYVIKYDLTDKPTFTYELTIPKGITFEDYAEKISNLGNVFDAYSAVCYVQGVNDDDALSYISQSIRKEQIKLLNEKGQKEITIINDLDPDYTGTKEPQENVIYESEFGDRYMEYINATHPEGTISDKDEYNTYSLTTSYKDKTDASCTIVYTLTINPEGDFASINGYEDRLEEEDKNKQEQGDEKISQIIDKDSSKYTSTPKSTTSSQSTKDDTTSKTSLPKAGQKNVMIIAIGGIAILAIIYFIVIRKNKDIK